LLFRRTGSFATLRGEPVLQPDDPFEEEEQCSNDAYSECSRQPRSSWESPHAAADRTSPTHPLSRSGTASLSTTRSLPSVARSCRSPLPCSASSVRRRPTGTG